MSARVTLRELPKASPIRRETVATLTLIFDRVPPPLDTLMEIGDWYDTNAHAVADALDAHCPQGFTDALFAELARRKASVLRVAKSKTRRRLALRARVAGSGRREVLIGIGKLAIDPAMIVPIHPRGDEMPGTVVRFKDKHPGDGPGNETISAHTSNLPYDEAVAVLARATIIMARGGSGSGRG